MHPATEYPHPPGRRLEHETVTTFVLDTVTTRAATVAEQRRDMTLSDEAFDRFIGALDAPVDRSRN
ncbi:MAG: DUF1778 domain-containing protein [Acidimicrobiales bacterium]